MAETSNRTSNEASESASEPTGESVAAATPGDEPGASERRGSEVLEQTGALLRAAHPRQALLTGLVVGGAAFVSGRPAREAFVAGAAILVVQAVLGLLDDARDADRDQANGADGKPIAEGHLPRGNATFVAGCLAIVSVPLALQNGAVAALCLLAYGLLALLSQTGLRRTALSWLPWAASYAVLPAYLAYGGWGGAMHGAPPTWQMTVLAALLGVCVHFLTSLPHLVVDNRANERHLPLRIALRMGAGRLLAVTGVLTALVALGILLTSFGAGLRQ